MVSPGALLAAGLFGAALHRNHQLREMRMLALLEPANAGQPLVFRLLSRTRSDTTTH